VRVERLVDEGVWRDRYEQINAFERSLVAGGTTVVKFFLHISYEEQGRRLQERLDRPEKRWKLTRSDFTERGRWNEYVVAYDDVLTLTSTETAPWYVIPADHKWFRNWVVSNILVDVLDAMDPRYPEPPPLEGVTVS
jgi:polyphosphate kinase 2 (PPK2 family)